MNLVISLYNMKIDFKFTYPGCSSIRVQYIKALGFSFVEYDPIQRPSNIIIFSQTQTQ